jgi:hypothetical protein
MMQAQELLPSLQTVEAVQCPILSPWWKQTQPTGSPAHEGTLHEPQAAPAARRRTGDGSREAVSGEPVSWQRAGGGAPAGVERAACGAGAGCGALAALEGSAASNSAVRTRKHAFAIGHPFQDSVKKRNRYGMAVRGG